MLSRFLPVAPQTSLCAISLCKRIPGRQRYCKSATMVAALETSDKLTFYDLGAFACRVVAMYQLWAQAVHQCMSIRLPFSTIDR